MSTISLDDFLESRGLTGDKGIERAYREALSSLPLAALREEAHLTQKDMAKRLRKSQAAVSKFEGRGDFLLSTLFQYVQAMAGSIELSIKVAGKTYDIVGDDSCGDFYFRLLSQQQAEACHAEKVIKLRRERATAPLRTVPSTIDWRDLKSGKGYEKPAKKFFSNLAANDEPESIAA